MDVFCEVVLSTWTGDLGMKMEMNPNRDILKPNEILKLLEQ